MRNYIATICLGTLLILLQVERAPAERLQLTHGGIVNGEVVFQSATICRVKTESGVLLQIPTSSIRGQIQNPPTNDGYSQRLSTLPNTSSAHWELAIWCRDQGLQDEMVKHATVVVEREPDHVHARHALGYSQVGGKWVLSRDVRKEQGYVLYHGRWLLPQQIELIKQRRAKDLGIKRWMRQISRWRESLDRKDRDRETVIEFAANVRAIDDPLAVTALAEQLGGEPIRSVKFLYIDALIKLKTKPALDAILHASINDQDEEIFHRCLERLVDAAPNAVVGSYVDALASPNNVQVNRAAYALGHLKNESAIPALIAALFTQHGHPSVANQRSPDLVSTTFDNSGSGGAGLQAGAGPKAKSQRVPNPQVLNALVLLSGGRSFGYDQQAWRIWYTAERRQAAATVDARRESR